MQKYEKHHFLPNIFGDKKRLTYFCKKKKGDMKMDKTITLQQSVMQDVVSLMDDGDAMKKLKKYLRKLINERDEEMSKAEKKEILDDIRQGLIEVREARRKGIKLQSAKDFLNEIRG